MLARISTQSITSTPTADQSTVTPVIVGETQRAAVAEIDALRAELQAEADKARREVEEQVRSVVINS